MPSCCYSLQYTKQRVSRPDYGLREDVLLPWYTELARQYTAQPYGAPWHGNRTLIRLYETLAWTAGEDRWARAGTRAGAGCLCLLSHLSPPVPLLCDVIRS